MTYHDPCYLGRHNGVYDEPREALKQVPGLQLHEMPESRKNSFCCGGGGGRIWMETPKGERFSDLRLAQAIGVGAQVLVDRLPLLHHQFRGQQAERWRTATRSRSRTSPKSSGTPFGSRGTCVAHTLNGYRTRARSGRQRSLRPMTISAAT